MSKNTKINWQGTGGDAEGHAIKGHVDDGSQADDAEGHALRGPENDINDRANDDAEGHGFRGNIGDGSQADDAEGHRFKFSQLDDGSQAEDAEGHGRWTPSSAQEREINVDGRTER
jgi:hypothetical protein